MSARLYPDACEYCNKDLDEVFAIRGFPEFRVNESTIYPEPSYVCKECFDKNERKLEGLE